MRVVCPWLPRLSTHLVLAVGEVLYCEREPTNSQDRYAVAVKKDETVILPSLGHFN